MTFSDYSGEIMDIKMKYATILTQDYSNYINLKLAFPFTSNLDDWYVGISYYRIVKIGKFKRIALGLDGSVIISTVSSQVQNTIPGLNLARADSSYISYFLGPSALIWLLSPERRYFATYAGCTFAYNFNQNNIGLQPFIGTRVVLDFNKALNLELRYIYYNLDVANYSFNLYGNANRTETSKEFDAFMINIGLQVLF
jgi:hypothetical protein